MKKGEKCSEELKNKIRLSNLGKKRSEETRKRISKTKKGQSLINAGSFKGGHIPWNKGLKVRLSQKSEFKKGNKPYNWKGFTIKEGGYILIHFPEHPNADNKGYVPDHRLIAERALGRHLKSNEIVHHGNEDPSDNRNSNLVICTIGYHLWLHRKIKKIRRQNGTI